MSEQTKMIEDFANREYEHGFVTDIEQDTFRPDSAKTWFARSRPRRMNPSG